MKSDLTNALRRKHRPRHVRTKANLEPIRITSRDYSILRSVGDYRILSTGQVCKLYFRTIQKARKRLFKLWQHGLLDRRFQPVRLGDRPSETLYVLTRHGAHVLASRIGLSGNPPQSAPPERSGSALFLAHTLARNDFRLHLELSIGRHAGWTLGGWSQGTDIARTISFVSQRPAPSMVHIKLIADGYFVLNSEDHVLQAYVEIDRGTISLKRLAVRLEAYRALYRHQVNHGERGFCVLFVVSSPQRLENIKGILARLAHSDEGIFALAVWDGVKAADHDLLTEKVWQSIKNSGGRIGEKKSIAEIANGKNRWQVGGTQAK